MADYHAHPAVPITSHTKRPNNPLDYTAEDGERRPTKKRRDTVARERGVRMLIDAIYVKDVWDARHKKDSSKIMASSEVQFLWCDLLVIPMTFLHSKENNLFFFLLDFVFIIDAYTSISNHVTMAT